MSETIEITDREDTLAEHTDVTALDSFHRPRQQNARGQTTVLTYIILPAIFLAVTLLGGFRLAAADNAFIFLKPPLICLIFAVVSIVLMVRSGLISLDGWFSHDFSAAKNAANAGIVLTAFTAAAQIYNSLLPEQGLPFWVIGFCFLWTLWNNLFADFDTKTLFRSLAGLFGLAFAAKYLLLANLTVAESGSWLSRIIENPGKEAMIYLLDIPRYSTGTPYIQFFTLLLFLLGLYLTPRTTDK